MKNNAKSGRIASAPAGIRSLNGVGFKLDWCSTVERPAAWGEPLQKHHHAVAAGPTGAASTAAYFSVSSRKPAHPAGALKPCSPITLQGRRTQHTVVRQACQRHSRTTYTRDAGAALACRCQSPAGGTHRSSVALGPSCTVRPRRSRRMLAVCSNTARAAGQSPVRYAVKPAGGTVQRQAWHGAKKQEAV